MGSGVDELQLAVARLATNTRPLSGSTATVLGRRPVAKRATSVSCPAAVDRPTTSLRPVSVTHGTWAASSWATPYGVPRSS